MNDWAVFRQDYTGNEFLVEQGLTEQEAEDLAADYIARGHHQHYWAGKQPEQVDFTELFKEMLSSGSAVKMAIQVLLSQGASRQECLNILENESKLDHQQSLNILCSFDNKGSGE